MAYNLLAAARTVAVHMTCYEHAKKVLGLKAANVSYTALYIYVNIIQAVVYGVYG